MKRIIPGISEGLIYEIFVESTKTDIHIKNITRTPLTMGKTIEEIHDIPAGNICCFGGLNQFILKVAAIIDGLKAFLIINIKYSVSSVVQLVIQAMKPAELIRQIGGLP